MRRNTSLGVAALAGGVGLLSLLNLHLLRSPIDTSPIAPAAGKSDAPRADTAALATALDKRTAGQFGQTVARPLFHPSRRPVRRGDPVAAEPTAQVGGLRLVGVMKAGNGPPRALLRSAGGPTGKWIAEGGAFNGWIVRKVNDRSVIVQSGRRSQELTLAAPRRRPAEPSESKR